MNQVVVDIPKDLEDGFLQQKTSLADFLQQYITLRQQEKGYSFYTDDLLNPISFEGDASACVQDLRSLIK